MCRFRRSTTTRSTPTTRSSTTATSSEESRRRPDEGARGAPRRCRGRRGGRRRGRARAPGRTPTRSRASAHEDIHTADIVIEIPSDAPLAGARHGRDRGAAAGPRVRGGWLGGRGVGYRRTPAHRVGDRGDSGRRDSAPRPRPPRSRPGARCAAQPPPWPDRRPRRRPPFASSRGRRSCARCCATTSRSTSKRLDDLTAADRETPDLLTADRLLEHKQVVQPEPEGMWRHLLYSLSGRRINLGDSKRARDRKDPDAPASPAPLAGGARFVPVLSRKGGVGKTTVTALLGMALADARDDRIIAVDANPDRGTLADRIARPERQDGARSRARPLADLRLQRHLEHRRARRDAARHPRVRHRPARVRGLQRRRLPRGRRGRRALLLDRADRHRHRHRALRDGGDARPRRPARGRRRVSASTRRAWRPRR